MPRSTHATAILGADLAAQLPRTRVLMVGAGGIGCELLKNVVLTGFGRVTLLDLDTIDLSNLNRQFLFRKRDVKKPKAMVAAKTALAFNPSCFLEPIHGNVKDEEFDVEWFQSFDIVLNALDNLDARRHVNKMCLAAKVPLIESGTAGYLGQVQPIIQNVTECFDCMPKETPKTFPVCTIRSTPSTPIHCIVWAKSYLLQQLVGEQEAEAELDEAAAQGENAAEIAALRKEAAAFNHVRQSLLSSPPEIYCPLVFNKIFKDDINRLLSMSDMWKSRKPPTPLDRQSILLETAELPPPAAANGTLSGRSASLAKGSPRKLDPGSQDAKLRDQRELNLKENLELFDSSLFRLSMRLKSGKETSISFDKDDGDTLDFVTATANLRATAYGIETKTRWDVKEMAGNIIPAIATTNAVIAGLIVFQALQVLRTKASGKSEWSIASSSSPDGARSACLQIGKASVPLGTYFLSTPNPACGVCRDQYATVQCDPSRTTLGEILEGILRAEQAPTGTHGKRDVSVYEGTRLLSDPDFDDNHDRSLEDLHCTRGKFLTIVDEDETYENLALAICLLPEGHDPQAASFLLPSPFPVLKLKPVKKVEDESEDDSPPPQTGPSSRKRSAPDDDDLPPPPKRAKNQAGNAEPAPLKETEDGVILIDDDEDEDVMEIL